ncbi:MAG: hypothetical protein WC619_04335 [Patescibacteria group bacterium]
MKSFSLLLTIMAIAFIGCATPIVKRVAPANTAAVPAKVDTVKTAVSAVLPTFAIEKAEGMKINILFPLLFTERYNEGSQFSLYAAYAYYDTDSTWAAVEQENYVIETSRVDGDPLHLRGIVSLPADSKYEFFAIRVEGREFNSGQILEVAETDMAFRKDNSDEPGCEFGFIKKTGKVIIPVPKE